MEQDIFTTKKELYEKSLKQLENFLTDHHKKEKPLSFEAILSIIAAAVNLHLGQHLIFCGFYIVKQQKDEVKFLEIGPFQGKLLPIPRIELGKGVCGTA